MTSVMAAKAAINDVREFRLRSGSRKSVNPLWIDFMVNGQERIRQLQRLVVDGSLRGHDDTMVIPMLKLGVAG